MLLAKMFAYCHKMQYCMQVEAVFSSEIIWTDVLNAQRWKQRSKNYENACNHLCPSKQRLPPNLDARIRGKYPTNT